MRLLRLVGLVCTTFALVVPVSFGAPAVAARPGSPVERDLAAALRVALGESRAQSISAAVVFADGTTWSDALGVADDATGRRARPATPYAVASITKMFVAAVAMQLVHEKVLELDEPVARWLPQLRDADRITVRDLLGHTSGMVLTPFVDDPTFRWTPDQVLDRSGEPACEPATCFRYSDNNYAALGQVIASATGRPVEDSLRERIVEPLHLEHAWLQGFEPPRGRVAPAQAGGPIFDDPEGNAPSTEFVTRTGASGALAATAIDVARFADALFRGRVVDREGLAAMTDFNASAELPCPEAQFCNAYGLGVQFSVIDGWRVLAHSGSTGTIVAYFPEQHVTIAVLTNGRGNPYLAASALAKAIPTIRNELDLFTLRSGGTHPRRLAHGEPRRSGASMSPDGTRLAFSRGGRDRNRDLDIMVANKDGSHERTLVGGPRSDGSPAWSPDGTRLAYSSADGDHAAIYLVDADGTHRRRLTDGVGYDDGPAWSPDGSLIAYHRHDRSDLEIRVVNADGTGARTILRMPVTGPWTGFPSWMPGGSHLVFTGQDGADTDIQVVALDGSGLATLTDNHVDESEAAASPDGRVAFEKSADIYVMAPGDPSSIQQVTNTTADEFAFEWVERHKSLVFTSRVAVT